MGSAALKSICRSVVPHHAPSIRARFITLGVMSNYTAAVEFFSEMCQTQLNQPLSRLDAANDGLSATLVLHPERTAP